MKVIKALLLSTTVSAFIPSIKNLKSSIRLNEKENDDTKDELWNPSSSRNKNDDGMSLAIPFAQRPKLLDGSLPGDVGFDPFGFAGEEKAGLINMREAEIKHGRLAMLAVVGWPLAELWDSKIAAAFGLESALTTSGKSPSLLNGGLDKIAIEFWIATVCVSGLIELANMDKKDEEGKNYVPGDCNFDPLNLFPSEKREQFIMQTKEIKHGRIAMMAILGFVVQEALYGIPVVSETPFFFSPIWS